MNNKAFTLIELIFTIVIIGVLASVAIPKFAGLSDNSKIAAELSTASSVQSALDACHGEWIINEGSFTCGKSISSADLNSNGYPKENTLGDSNDNPLNQLLKNTTSGVWEKDANDNTKYYGPASKTKNGVATSNCKDYKPCIGKYWKFDNTDGTFVLK